MKIYLAARFSQYAEMREVRRILEAVGHTVTSRWIDLHSVPPNTDRDEALETFPSMMARFAREDIEDIWAAEAVVSFTSKETGGRGGRHVEFGFALALEKKLIIVGPRENVFHCLEEVTVIDNDVPALLDELARPRGSH